MAPPFTIPISDKILIPTNIHLQHRRRCSREPRRVWRWINSMYSFASLLFSPPEALRSPLPIYTAGESPGWSVQNDKRRKGKRKRGYSWNQCGLDEICNCLSEEQILSPNFYDNSSGSFITKKTQPHCSSFFGEDQQPLSIRVWSTCNVVRWYFQTRSLGQRPWDITTRLIVQRQSFAEQAAHVTIVVAFVALIVRNTYWPRIVPLYYCVRPSLDYVTL